MMEITLKVAVLDTKIKEFSPVRSGKEKKNARDQAEVKKAKGK